MKDWFEWLLRGLRARGLRFTFKARKTLPNGRLLNQQLSSIKSLNFKIILNFLISRKGGKNLNKNLTKTILSTKSLHKYSLLEWPLTFSHSSLHFFKFIKLKVKVKLILSTSWFLFLLIFDFWFVHFCLSCNPYLAVTALGFSFNYSRYRLIS